MLFAEGVFYPSARSVIIVCSSEYKYGMAYGINAKE
jgi:hypothetical protein